MAQRLFCCVAALIAFAVPIDAFACRCKSTTPEQNVDVATDVFWGEVTKVERSDRRLTATLRVGKRFKGAKQKVVKVGTNRHGSACGVRFELGESYLVFTYMRDKQLAASTCNGTRRMRVEPASATAAKEPQRDLSRQRAALDPVLKPIVEKLSKECDSTDHVELTIYDNGEFDVSTPNMCWSQHSPKLVLPALPAGYPFVASIAIWGPDSAVRYRDAMSKPLLRGHMYEDLRAKITGVSPRSRLLAFQLRSLGDQLGYDHAEMVCTLSGEEAMTKYLSDRANGSSVAKHLLNQPDEHLYRCAVARHDWKRAAELSAKLNDQQVGPIEKRIRAETAALKGHPRLSNMSVSPDDVLRIGRTTRDWTNDVVVLQLMAQALLAKSSRPGDKRLAALAYARAALLHHPVDAELLERARKLGGQAVVIEMKALASEEEFVQRAEKALDEARKSGRAIPDAPR